MCGCPSFRATSHRVPSEYGVPHRGPFGRHLAIGEDLERRNNEHIIIDPKYTLKRTRQEKTQKTPTETKGKEKTKKEMDNIKSNDFFGAGIGLLAVTTTLALLRKSALLTASFAQKRLTTQLEITSKDQSYPWFLNWYSKQPQPLFTHTLSLQTHLIKHTNGSIDTKFNLVPGTGKHWFKYMNIWIMMDRIRAEKMVDLTNAQPWETITLTTLARHKNVFNHILIEARTLELQKHTGKTVIFTSFGHEWRPFGSPRAQRLLSSVILNQGVSEAILTDVKQFLNNASWYANRGIPYRRGYLLYGVPGSGKSSFIQALAGELNYNICVLSLGEQTMTDDRLNHLLVHAPPRTLLLLEDVDAAFLKREAKTGYTTGVTFSGLLNALDGVTSSEERIIFMTTNHISRLSTALIRPGRVDYRQLFTYASKDQMRRMFVRFYPGKEELAQKFADRIGDRNVSTAALQGLFLLWRDDANAAIDHVETLFHTVSDDVGEKLEV